MTMTTWGLALVVCGIVYLVKPNIFQRWFWKRTDIFQQIFTPEKYLVFMRVLGGLSIATGIILLILGRHEPGP